MSTRAREPSLCIPESFIKFYTPRLSAVIGLYNTIRAGFCQEIFTSNIAAQYVFMYNAFPRQNLPLCFGRRRADGVDRFGEPRVALDGVFGNAVMLRKVIYCCSVKRVILTLFTFARRKACQLLDHAVVQTPVIAHLRRRKMAPRNLRRDNPYQRFLAAVEFHADRSVRYFMFRANLVFVVPVDDDVVPQHYRLTAAVLSYVVFEPLVGFRVERRQQTHEFLVDFYFSH